jgi:hypothetical protein
LVDINDRPITIHRYGSNEADIFEAKFTTGAQIGHGYGNPWHTADLPANRRIELGKYFP